MKSLSAAQVSELEARARRTRQQVLEMFAIAGGGHFGGSLSVVEILVTLYGAVLRVDPTNPGWPDRDRLVLSKGHAGGTFCAVLANAGFFDDALLETFNRLDSPFGMHPDMHKIPGCDMSSGSLGHGLAVGIGMALAGRADGKDYRVYVVMGDGECQEGTVWEAAMTAAHLKLDSLTAVVDRNRLSLDGRTEELNALEPLAERWRAFGWHVVEVDGHNVSEIYRGIQEAHATRGCPTVLLAHTIKGKGISFMEDTHQFHYAVLSTEQLEAARAELGRGS
ncbi:MAG: transketolase [Anaerolineae bacterium]